MRGAWYVGRVKGIPIQIHWSFCLILLWSAYLGYKIGGWNQIAFSVLFTVLLFVCVLLHELGHALTAGKFGIFTQSITLLPIGGVAALKRIPERPLEEFLITLAGPMVNVCLAGVLYLIFGWPDEEISTALLWSPEHFGHMLLYTNIIMAVFNMLPAFPMDGGRLLRAFLAVWLSYQKATAIASLIGRVIAIAMVVAGLFLNPFLSLIGLMVYAGATTENHWVTIRSLLDGLTVRDFMIRDKVVLTNYSPIKDGIHEVYKSGRSDFVIMSGNAITGILPHDVWLQHLKDGDHDICAGNVMSRNFIVLDCDMPAYGMCRMVMSSKQLLFPIVHHGEFEGIITRDMVSKLMRGNAIPRVNQRSGSKDRPSASFIDVG